jgi:hypothetical protein
MRCGLLLLVSAGVLAGCGSSKSDAGKVGGALPGCVDVRPAQVSAAFPTELPFPEGTAVRSEREDGGFRVVETYVPGDLGAAADYYRSELKQRGFALGEGDPEDHEAETEFSGNGVGEGRLKLHDIDGCDGALTLEVAVKSAE